MSGGGFDLRGGSGGAGRDDVLVGRGMGDGCGDDRDTGGDVCRRVSVGIGAGREGAGGRGRDRSEMECFKGGVAARISGVGARIVGGGGRVAVSLSGLRVRELRFAAFFTIFPFINASWVLFLAAAVGAPRVAVTEDVDDRDSTVDSRTLSRMGLLSVCLSSASTSLPKLDTSSYEKIAVFREGLSAKPSSDSSSSSTPATADPDTPDTRFITRLRKDTLPLAVVLGAGIVVSTEGGRSFGLQCKPLFGAVADTVALVSLILLVDVRSWCFGLS